MIYKCDVCSRVFENSAQLGGHRGGHTRRKEAAAAPIVERMNGVCPDCGDVFENSWKLAGHRRLMHSPWESFRTDIRRKSRLLIERGHRCETCGLTMWMGKSIPIQLEHKDGNPNNSAKENLSLICPNCHAQTDTYCGKNIGRPKCRTRERTRSYREHSLNQTADAPTNFGDL